MTYDMTATPRLALYQPDMAPNTGAMMRLCACMGVGLDIIEPCGFVLDDKRLRRGALDYTEHLTWTRHASWHDFSRQKALRRLVLLTTKARMPYYDFSFRSDDILLVGSESSGVPDEVHASVDAKILIPIQPQTRSLNVAMAGAIVLSEALRQVRASP